jgi:hypothetical protein
MPSGRAFVGGAEPDEEVHTFINDLEREVGTHLLGRRLYEVMSSWETIALVGQPSFIRDFAELWRAADKIVYSKTLKTLSTARTLIERDFHPEAVRLMKAAAHVTSPWAVPLSPLRCSRRGWSMRCTCSPPRS